METVVYRPLRPEVAQGTKSEWLLKQRRVDSAPSSAPLLLLVEWRNEVLNYSHYPATNALGENKHNRVKIPKRRANGYRNDGASC